MSVGSTVSVKYSKSLTLPTSLVTNLPHNGVFTLPGTKTETEINDLYRRWGVDTAQISSGFCFPLIGIYLGLGVGHCE